MTNKKICIIGPGLEMGGIERASVNLANALSSNFNVSYISIFRKRKFLKLSENVVFFEPHNFNESKLSFFKTVFFLRKTIKSVEPSKIISFNKFYSAIVMLSQAFINKYPVFISERSSPFFKWQKKLAVINRIIFTFFPPAGIIAQTEIAAKFQAKYYKKKVRISVIPNILKPVNLYPNIERKKFVLAVGRLNDHLKGFDRLIKAFALVKAKDWMLVFAGGDKDEGNLKNLSIKYSVQDKVKFLGKVNEIDKIYAEASIFVIPSRSEGFPNALCEAMAAGLPCISFDFVAGPKEIITDKVDGLLVENGNIYSMAKKIQFLVDSPEERTKIGTNALRIRERLDEKKITQKIIEFLYS